MTVGSPFVDETRDEVVTLNLPGLSKIRMPSSLLRLFKIHKRSDESVANYLLRSGLKNYLLDQISAERYDNVQATLAALYGRPGNGWDRRATDVAVDHARGNGASR